VGRERAKQHAARAVEVVRGLGKLTYGERDVFQGLINTRQEVSEIGCRTTLVLRQLFRLSTVRMVKEDCGSPCRGK